MHITNFNIIIFILFSFTGNSVLASNINKEGVGIEAFGGIITIPPGFTLEINQWPEKFLRFNNLDLNNNVEINSQTTIRIGVPDEELKIFISKANLKMVCSSFNRAELVIDNKNGKIYVSYLYDEKIYIAIVSSDRFFLQKALKRFAECPRPLLRE